MMQQEESESLQFPEIVQVREGIPVDDLPDREGFRFAIEKKKKLRHAGFELRVEGVFEKAIKCLVDCLEGEEPEIRIKAASKLLDLRRDVYKAQSTEKTTETVINKLFEDGFNF
jgi:hypothetical protein